MENNIVNLSLKKEEEPNDLISKISDVKDASENALRKYLTSEEYEPIKQIVPPLHFNSSFEDFAEIVSERYRAYAKNGKNKRRYEK